MPGQIKQFNFKLEKMMSKTVRILADTVIDGLQYKANQVVELPDDLAKQQIKDGAADGDKAGVKYCVEELGAKTITHVSESQRAREQQIAAARASLDELRARAAAETDAEKRAALDVEVTQAAADLSALEAAA